MSLILSADTSTNAGSVALWRDTQVLGVVETFSTESHSARLFPAIKFLMDQLHLSLAEVDAFGVVTGPGSFAGLRIGVGAMKGFAEMHQKPVIGVSTLEAIAASACQGGDYRHEGIPIIALIDARRSELYAGSYQHSQDGWKQVAPDRLTGVQDFFDSQRKERCIFVGPEIEKFAPHILPCGEYGWTMQRTTWYLAGIAAKLAHDKLQKGCWTPIDEMSIHYLRPSDAQIMFKG